MFGNLVEGRCRTLGQYKRFCKTESDSEMDFKSTRRKFGEKIALFRTIYFESRKWFVDAKRNKVSRPGPMGPKKLWSLDPSCPP